MTRDGFTKAMDELKAHLVNDDIFTKEEMAMSPDELARKVKAESGCYADQHPQMAIAWLVLLAAVSVIGALYGFGVIG